MSLSAMDYAALAKDAYQDRRHLVGTPKTIDVGGHQYYIRAAQSRPSGFQAASYQEAKPPYAIIIAYRGTQGLHDALVDTVMVADKVNPQEADARAFTGLVLDYAKQHGIPTSEVAVTGHSLGGTLAEIEAWRFGLHGDTFNAYGAVDLGYGVPQGGSSVTDYVEATDVVSAASRHFGQVVPLATHQDVALLGETSIFGSHVHAIEIAKQRGLSAHSIANFAPDAGGTSILTPDDVARAQTNIQAIHSYRNNIHALRSQIHLVSEVPGNPVWTVSRTGEIADGLTTAGDTLAHETTRGLRAVGRFAEREAAATQQGAERVGKAIARATHHASEEFAQHASSVEQAFGTTLHEVTAALPGLNHFGHPQHALYAALKERLPADTSEARLAQATAACHLAKLDRPEDLGQIHVTRTSAMFLNNSLFGHMTEIDLTRPAPTVEHSLRQIEHYDQQQRNPTTQPKQHMHGHVQ